MRLDEHPKERNLKLDTRAIGHIVVIDHEQGGFEEGGYVLGSIIQLWQEMGLKVSIQKGLDPIPDADLAIMHVDLTQVPDNYLASARHYPKVLNSRVADISKRTISADVVRRGDGYKGPVIVKTDNNCGGAREADLARQNSGLTRYIRAVRRRLPWALQSDMHYYDYKVYDSVSEVPKAVWFNRDLVIERFLPEVEDGHYCLRSWVFLGDKEVNFRSFSEHKIIKGDRAVRREMVPEVPDDLRQRRKDLGFDYGKFDYAIVNGRAVLYDANRTPVIGPFGFEKFLPFSRILAEGIHCYR